MNKQSLIVCTAILALGFIGSAYGTTIGITGQPGSQALDYIIGTPAEIPFNLGPNFSDDQKLYVWDEVQNFLLTEDLPVDRVADASASFIIGTPGDYSIKAGTYVSSHYVQWDPQASAGVNAILEFDSEIFAFITSDSKLFSSDSDLGLAGINYGDFANRGLEGGDITDFMGNKVEIDWAASNPGDWTRLITAFSPSADGNVVPEPTSLLLLGTGLGALGLTAYRRKRK